MKTLYIHIGTAKTGTTAIQKFCWHNRNRLEQYGYCYPEMDAFCTDVAKTRNGHFLLKQADSGETGAWEKKYEESMKKINNLFLTCDNIILSDEAIWHATYKRQSGLWEKLGNQARQYGFCVRIVVYLRRQDDYIMSVWNQRVKMGKGMNAKKTVDEFVADISMHLQLDYYEKLQSIAEVLGKENIIVRRYEKNHFYGDSIYADFLHAVGLQLTEEYEIEKEVRNLSLEGNTSEIMRVLNSIPRMDETQYKIFERVLLEESSVLGERPSYSMLSREEREQILADYEDSNCRVAREYLGEEQMFEHEIEDLPKYTPDNAYMYEDIIRFTGISILYMMERNQKLAEEIQKMKNENRTFREKIKHPLRSVLERT